MQSQQTNPNFTPVFTVFKQGVTTDGPIIIMRKAGEPFNLAAKVEKYTLLGYTVTML